MLISRMPVVSLSDSVVINGQTVFGASSADIVTIGNEVSMHVAIPLLAGSARDGLLANAQKVHERSGAVSFRNGGLLAGFLVAEPGEELSAASADLYQQLFTACRGLHLYRVWNYVPHINAGTGGMENYRHFCRGRSLAFEGHFGVGFAQLLPAASAVGAVAGPLAMSFLAGEGAPQHFENPRQVSAFNYPSQYGPRSPSFARATVFADQGLRRIMISGTAAIIGHESVAAGDLDRQIDCTLENLCLIGETAGAGPAMGVGDGGRRTFTVYVRHAADLGHVTARLERDLLRSGDTACYLRADICRADLLVEIEAVLVMQCVR